MNCPDCQGDGVIYELALRGKTWVRRQSHVCTRCKGSGHLADAPACRYCGKPTPQLDNGYCSDVCEFASAQPKTVKLERHNIHCQVSAPPMGWEYGQAVEVIRGKWVIEIRPALGGHTLYRVRPKGSAVKTGLIVVDKADVI